MSIQAIDRTSVHRLTSGQVVIDLQTAVKELIENALDAGATNISVKFREHGLEEIEVEDNGRGIDKEDWAGLALKHHTSKLASFDDLASVETLGFRGEALSSLCGVATLSMTTSTSPTLPLGTALSFTHAGECIVGGKVSRSKGTTVKVERLFEHLPVRRKELTKNAKREMAKAIDLVTAYALVKTGVRFEVRNILKGKSQIHLQTPASTSLRANFSNIFAPKSLASLMDLDLTLEVPTDKTVIKRLEDAGPSSTGVRVTGLISKPSAPHGRPAGNRQFYYVNGRPFAPSKVAKAVNEVYKAFNLNQFPVVVADFQLAPDAYDVNVSPDKRTIFLHSEANLIACLKDALLRFFEPEKGTFAMQAIGPSRQDRSKEPLSGDSNSDDDKDLEPPLKKKRAEDGSPIATSSSASGRLPPSRPSSRSSSIVVEITDPFGLDDLDEAVLPDPPASYSSDSLAAGTDLGQASHTGAELSPRHPSAVAQAQPLFRQPSATPAPPRSPSPFERPSATTSAQNAKKALPPRMAQSRLDFAAETRSVSTGKVRDVTTAGPPSSKAASGSAAHRMQTVLRQFLNGAPQRRPNDDELDELKGENADGTDGAGAGDPAVSTAADGARRPTPDLPPGARSPQLRQQSPLHEELVDPSARPLSASATNGDEDDIIVDELPEDVILVVEDSFRAASPNRSPRSPRRNEDELPLQARTGEDDESPEAVAASCVCVDGSQDSDVEIHETRPASRAATEPRVAVSEPPSDLPLIFGAAQSEVAGTFVAADASLSLDLASLEALWTQAPAAPARSAPPDTAKADELVGAGIEERDDAAEATLSRVVSKADFDAMEIVGQFNLGFIIARRRVQHADKHSVSGVADIHDDLFIVDQHASDEKYNFERLQAETVIQSQRLLAPRILNLPSSDEITAMEHTDVLRMNGFEVIVDENADVGERVKLAAQPVSRETVFDVGDLEELVELIATSASSEVVRPTKARRMFASRACRKSVMIGKALNNKQMSTILQHMGGMDQPWACPHGRPTMRWLAQVLADDARPDLRQTLDSLQVEYCVEKRAVR